MEEPMNRVKAFEVPSFAQRHGSLDKVPASSFAQRSEYFEITCPDCDSVLCVDASLLAVSPEFDCAGCGELIALSPDGSLRVPVAGRRAVGEA
jgi:ribosomal protein S27E